MTDSQDPTSCAHGNVSTVAGEFEHYDRLGPGCWHRAGGGRCMSWQALIEHVQSVAAGRAVARAARDIRAELVCCDVYERDRDTERAGRTHAICFWGEAGARIAEGGDTP